MTSVHTDSLESTGFSGVALDCPAYGSMVGQIGIALYKYSHDLYNTRNATKSKVFIPEK